MFLENDGSRLSRTKHWNFQNPRDQIHVTFFFFGFPSSPSPLGFHAFNPLPSNPYFDSFPVFSSTRNGETCRPRVLSKSEIRSCPFEQKKKGERNKVDSYPFLSMFVPLTTSSFERTHRNGSGPREREILRSCISDPRLRIRLDPMGLRRISSLHHHLFVRRGGLTFR